LAEPSQVPGFLVTAVDLISRIPEGIWGVLIGSLLTLLGAWIANRHNIKVQKLQFEFESRERRTERQLQMRRDVYLPAAEAVVGMVMCIARAIDPKTADENINNASESFGIAIAKVSMVASEETIRKALAIQRMFSSQLLAVMRDRYPLALRQSDINLAAKWMAIHQEERQRYIEMMKEYNLEGTKDRDRWNAIQHQLEFIQKSLDEETRQWTELTVVQLAAHRELAQSLPARLKPLQELQSHALAAIRGELELDGAGTVLLEEYQKTADEMQQALGGLLQVVQQTEAYIANDSDSSAEPAQDSGSRS
jgi:hypothetical protein